MLSTEELLFLQAVKDEEKRQTDMGAAAALGAGVGGLGLGAAGAGVHGIGNVINRVKGATPNRMKPGMRLAGSFTGLALGGAFGAGISAMMQRESPAARLMAKMQSGSMDEFSTRELESILAATYNKPSQIM